MISKKLNQLIDITLDTACTKPYAVRVVAEEIARLADDNDWSLADTSEARVFYLMAAVKKQMHKLLPLEHRSAVKSCVPRKYTAAIDNFPQTICITRAGENGPLHIHILYATKEQLITNFALKEYVEHKVRKTKYTVRDACEILEETGKPTLAALIGLPEPPP